MKFTRSIRSIALLALLTTLPASLIAQPDYSKQNKGEPTNEDRGKDKKDKDYKRGPNAEQQVKMLKKVLKLSDDQEIELMKQLNEADYKARQYDIEMHQLRNTLRDARKADVIDEESLLNSGRRLGELQVRSFLVRHNAVSNFVKTLSAEQQTAFEEFNSKRNKMNKNKRGDKKGPKGKKPDADTDTK